MLVKCWKAEKVGVNIGSLVILQVMWHMRANREEVDSNTNLKVLILYTDFNYHTVDFWVASALDSFNAFSSNNCDWTTLSCKK